MSEKEIVTSLVAGNEDAFGKVYEKYKDRLYHYCYSFTRSADAAEDLVQETFVKIWEFRERIDPNMFFLSYIRTIAYNKTISYLRSVQVENKIMERLFENDMETDENIVSSLVSLEYDAFLNNIIEKLPTQRKLIFKLSREQELPHKEIARQLGISVYTVQEHISESLRFIRSSFSNHPDISLPTSSGKKMVEITSVAKK